jgi:hypothetical protein
VNERRQGPSPLKGVYRLYWLRETAAAQQRRRQLLLGPQVAGLTDRQLAFLLRARGPGKNGKPGDDAR